MTVRYAGLALVGIAALALGLRAAELPDVFVGGDVFLAMWDGSYHARRALYSFEQFPGLLLHDPYLAFPRGAAVPLPPLPDWLLAAVARLTGDGVSHFERVAAWWSPLLAAATLWPVFSIARTLGGRGAGLTAAALFAVLPATVLVSRVGDVDHHAAVALWVALAAACTASAHATRVSTRGFAAAAVAMAAVRAGLAFTWSGSLLHLAVAELAWGAGAVARGGVRPWLAQALGAGAAALLVSPWVAAVGPPEAGPLASTMLSWLHVGFFVAVALGTGALALAERVRPSATWRARIARAIAVAVATGVVVSLVPALRAALLPGLAFTAGADAWAPANPEQQPLFLAPGWAGGDLGTSLEMLGGFAFAVPLAWLFALGPARDPSRRPAAVALAVWCACLGGLALLQARFANDFAAVGAGAFALALFELHRRLAARAGATASGVAVAAVAALLLAPAFVLVHAPRFARAFADPGPDAALRTGPGSLLRFARTIRAVTPETAGFVDGGVPAYGVLCKPSHGNAVVYAARRPTPANGFGPYLDAESHAAAESFYRARTEPEAVEIAQSLKARYAVTFDHHRLGPRRFVHFLHRLNGTLDAGWRHSEHFRLIAEGPAGGMPLWSSYPQGAPDGVVPYKLFEVVAGAVLEARTEPGEVVLASLELASGRDRGFTWRAAVRADPSGVARLRVPYASEWTGGIATEETVRARTRYRVRVGNAEHAVDVPEAAVVEGRTVSVP